MKVGVRTDACRTGRATRGTSGRSRGGHRPWLGLLAGARSAVVKEYAQRMPGDEHLVRLAVNEAEALAWQAGYPQLLFPTLAREKAQAVTAWRSRQRRLRPRIREVSYPA